jgi:hypothetical protein
MITKKIEKLEQQIQILSVRYLFGSPRGPNIQRREEVTGMQRKAVQENEKRAKYDVNSDWIKK